MAAEDVAVVRRMAEAFLRGEYAEALECFASDVVWEFGSDVLPGAASVYRGRDGIRQGMREWSREWADYEPVAPEFVDAGLGTAVTLGGDRGRGRVSGIALEREVGIVYRIRDGLIVHLRSYPSHASALAAAGATPE